MATYLLKKSYQHKDLKEINFKDLWESHGVFTTMWIFDKPAKILFFKKHIKNLIKSSKAYKINKPKLKKNILKLIKLNLDINKKYNHLLRVAIDNKIISIYPNGVKMNNNTHYMVIDADKIFNQPQIELYNIRGKLKNKYYLNPLVTGRQRVNLKGLIPAGSHSGIYFINFCFDDDNCIRQSITWLK